MRVKIIQNKQGDQCWYRNRIGEIFEVEPYYPLGLAFFGGDWNAGKADDSGKECLIAGEDCQKIHVQKKSEVICQNHLR